MLGDSIRFTHLVNGSKTPVLPLELPTDSQPPLLCRLLISQVETYEATTSRGYIQWDCVVTV